VVVSSIQLGQVPTFALIAGCCPTSIYCFFQALKRGEEERIADDKEFLRGSEDPYYVSDDEDDDA